MRRAVVNNGQFKFQYPEEVCFVFNPNYLEIESEDASSLMVDVSFSYDSKKMKSHSIIVSLYGNKTSVYLSRLFELMFQDPSVVRSLPLTIKIASADGGSVYFSFSTIAIWGSLAPGERFHTVGVYSIDPQRPYYERNLIWFKNFPFKISVFKSKSNTSFRGRFDSGTYELTFDEGKDSYAISAIDEYTNQKYVSGTIARPEYLTYFASLRKILAFYNGNWYWKWNANGSIPEYSEICNNDTGHPRTDVNFIVTDKDGYSWIYQYDGENFIKIGLKQSVGFCYLNPSRIFPSAKRSATIAYNLSNGMLSTFDETFDYTFRDIADESSALIHLTISDETTGYYLRWIDCQGNLQYFLFKKGKTTRKNNIGNNTKVIQNPLRNTFFPNMYRPLGIELTETHKCCAVNLSADIFDWVSTILTSVFIELYIGRDSDGNELWVPVTIENCTVDFNHNQQLHELEITIKTPSHGSQSL